MEKSTLNIVNERHSIGQKLWKNKPRKNLQTCSDVKIIVTSKFEQKLIQIKLKDEQINNKCCRCLIDD